MTTTPKTVTPTVNRERQLDTAIRRRILAPVTAAFASIAVLMVALDLFHVAIPPLVQVIPFGISILVFGLPHGALDHLVPARLDPTTSRHRSVLTVAGLYLVVGGATVALWHAAPTAGFVVFIGLTWFHWGQGDLFIDHLLHDGPTSRSDAALTVALRGAIPMLVPLAVSPHDYAAVFQQTVRTVHPASSATHGNVNQPLITAVIVAVVVALAVAQFTLRRISGRPTGRQLPETLTLIALFATTPPVLAVGLYFTLWHSTRHIIRLELTDPTTAEQLEAGRLGKPLIRFFRQAWPITAIAIVLLAITAALFHRADLGVYLVFIAALTTPHTIVVTWMDHRQHTWQTNPNPDTP